MDKKIILVQAVWDSEANVWVANSDDVPGLITEADTAAELEEKLKTLIPELLLENGVIDECFSDIPFHLHSERNKEIIAPCH
ncbi:MAG: DUF1902 domain-containing protein [Candidatus Polarisedimenticolaceae bacterium]|nr:DUF1902 domain-containing protein [Candidatus Polarisedimenticolaceae bacterium]